VIQVLFDCYSNYIAPHKKLNIRCIPNLLKSLLIYYLVPHQVYRFANYYFITLETITSFVFELFILVVSRVQRNDNNILNAITLRFEVV